MAVDSLITGSPQLHNVEMPACIVGVMGRCRSPLKIGGFVGPLHSKVVNTCMMLPDSSPEDLCLHRAIAKATLTLAQPEGCSYCG